MNLCSIILCSFVFPAGLHPDAGEVLADSVLSLRSMEKLSILDINPVPVLQVLFENAEYCFVSTLRSVFGDYPKLVRWLASPPCCSLHPVLLKVCLCTLCLQSCIMYYIHLCHLTWSSYPVAVNADAPLQPISNSVQPDFHPSCQVWNCHFARGVEWGYCNRPLGWYRQLVYRHKVQW